MKPRKRVAKGPERPRYLADRDLDRVMIMLVTLMAELSAVRDRLDTHEALADAGQPNATASVEAYAATEERESQREKLRLAMVRRVFRVIHEELGVAPELAPKAARLDDLDLHT